MTTSLTFSGVAELPCTAEEKTQMRQRQKPGDVYHIDPSKASVSSIMTRLSMRANGGTRIHDPASLSGGSALSFMGPTALQTQESKGSHVNVNFIEIGEVPAEAKSVFGRPVDRIGFNQPFKVGDKSASILKVPASEHLPLLKTGLGAALSSARELTARMSSRGSEAEAFISMFANQRGLDDRVFPMLDSIGVMNDSEVRSTLGSLKSSYHVMGAVEISKGLMSKRITLSDGALTTLTVDGSFENRSLDQTRLGVLATSVTSMMLARTAGGLSKFTLEMRPMPIVSSFRYTADAMSTMAKNIDYDGIFPDVPMLKTPRSEVRTDLGFIADAIAQQTSSRQHLAALIDEELVLAGLSRGLENAGSMPMETRAYELVPNANVTSLGSLLSRGEVRIAMKKAGKDPKDPVRAVEFDVTAAFISSLKIVLSSYLSTKPYLVAQLSRKDLKSHSATGTLTQRNELKKQNSRRVTDSRLGACVEDRDGNRLPLPPPPPDVQALLLEAIPTSLDHDMKYLMSMKGEYDFESEKARFFGNYADSIKLMEGESVRLALVRQISLKRPRSRFLYAIVAGAAKSAYLQLRSFGGDPRSMLLGGSLQEVAVRHLTMGLRLWAGNLASETKRERRQVVGAAKAGWQLGVSSKRIYVKTHVQAARNDLARPAMGNIYEHLAGLEGSDGSDQEEDDANEDDSEERGLLAQGEMSTEVVLGASTDLKLRPVPPGSLAWFRLLVVRQQCSRLLMRSVVSSEEGLVRVDIPSAELLPALKQSAIRRKENLKTRYEKRYADASKMSRRDLLAALGKAKMPPKKAAHAYAVKTIPVEGYSPATCAIDEARVEAALSLEALDAYLSSLPEGYIVAPWSHIVAAYSARVKLLIEDTTAAIRRILPTAQEDDDETPWPELPEQIVIEEPPLVLPVKGRMSAARNPQVNSVPVVAEDPFAQLGDLDGILAVDMVEPSAPLAEPSVSYVSVVHSIRADFPKHHAALGVAEFKRTLSAMLRTSDPLGPDISVDIARALGYHGPMITFGSWVSQQFRNFVRAREARKLREAASK